LAATLQVAVERVCHAVRRFGKGRRATVRDNSPKTGDKLTEVPRHRADIIRYQNPAPRCCNRENVPIRHTFRDDALRQFELNVRFAAKNTGDDILIETSVGKETNSQPYLGRASSRARFSFLDRLSGRGGCLAATSSDNPS
jgi:hypothetical protein